ncbi:MFS general substrate transporter [Clavulina sp. PMI_390]|nr:MFS general substrate transporter [Clavulina sp. PMI_390]
MSNMDLFAMSVSMAGAQIIWTMELGWGTPFLLQLGLSEQAASLVWLAGPISGLIAQPLIGAISDASTSRYRRRAWIMGSTALITFVSLILAYAVEIATFLVDAFGGGQGDWDPVRNGQINNLALGLAILSFCILDFALNALQASLRNLLLDITPAAQLGEGNAWHGRMIHAGNVVGFSIGFLNLGSWWFLQFIGGSQFRKICIVSLVVLIVSVVWTCWTQVETPGTKDFKNREGGLGQVIKSIVTSVINLPKPVRRVCYVQICAFMGWFPFLFFGTTWMGEIMAKETGIDPPVEEATQAGDLAMLFYSIVAIFAGTVLPWLNQLDQRLLVNDTPVVDEDDSDESESELQRVRELVRQWKAEAAREGKPLKLPTMPFMLRNIWTASLMLFALVMLATFWIRTRWQATVAISLLGISWACAVWVPFAIIMQFLRELETAAVAQRAAARSQAQAGGGIGYGAIGQGSAARPAHQRVASTPAHRHYPSRRRMSERTALVRRHSLMGTGGPVTNDLRYMGPEPVAGGTILGIHNLAVVLPQLVIAVLASAIFRIADKAPVADPPPVYLGKSGVSWVLRLGGLFAFIGVLMSRRVPPTQTEKKIRRRLAEMKQQEALGANGASP